MLPIFCPAVRLLSEDAVTIEFSAFIHPQAHQLVMYYSRKATLCPFPGLLDIVPAYTTLTVYFDPLQVPDPFPARWVARYLQTLLDQPVPEIPALAADLVAIGVRYDGPDLNSTAELLGIDTATLVRLHTETIYTVFMIGFLPGFAYMGVLPDALQAPRLPTPRPLVRAGSVGIAGAQTGIYPCDSPGGWRIIGHCDLALFDPANTPPSRLKAGDQVQFIAL